MQWTVTTCECFFLTTTIWNNVGPKCWLWSGRVAWQMCSGTTGGVNISWTSKRHFLRPWTREGADWGQGLVIGKCFEIIYGNHQQKHYFQKKIIVEVQKQSILGFLNPFNLMQHFGNWHEQMVIFWTDQFGHHAKLQPTKSIQICLPERTRNHIMSFDFVIVRNSNHS